MQRATTLLILALLWRQEPASGIRISELRAPTHVAAKGEALLGCQFDLEGDMLYSVKWYKDGKEIYRYVPKNSNPMNWFSGPGVEVDLSRSSSDVVTLVNLKKESTGEYRCEVSGEAPSFDTVSDAKYIRIQVLPETPPKIDGLRKTYKIGDRVNLNCTSIGSYPETQLRWLINSRPVKNGVKGPWKRVSDVSLDTIDVILQLKFVVRSSHFKNGAMEVKCQSTMAPLYQQETKHTITEIDNDEEPPSQPINWPNYDMNIDDDTDIIFKFPISSEPNLSEHGWPTLSKPEDVHFKQDDGDPSFAAITEVSVSLIINTLLLYLYI